MKPRVRASLAVVVVVVSSACGSPRPEVDFSQSIDAKADGDAPRDGAVRFHFISDVGVPSEPANASVVTSRDAGREPPRDAAADALDARDAAREGPEGPRDTGLGGDASASFEGGGDAVREATDDCATDGWVGHHLLIGEIVTRPSGGEMIAIVNPTSAAVDLSDYFISDSHLYYKIASSTFTTSSGSDFAARFPEGASIGAGERRVVALANASGAEMSFASFYGRKPDFELRPTANGAEDDPSVPNMRSAQASPSIGVNGSLTDGGEPVVLFVYRTGPRVFDVDYVFYGVKGAANPPVDKTSIAIDGGADERYADDTPAALQSVAAAPPEGSSLCRCKAAETGERATMGNGLSGHDETSEDVGAAFAIRPLRGDR